MAQAIVWQVPNLAQAVVDSSAGTLTFQTYDTSTSSWVTQWTMALSTGNITNAQAQTITGLLTASGGLTGTGNTGSLTPGSGLTNVLPQISQGLSAGELIKSGNATGLSGGTAGVVTSAITFSTAFPTALDNVLLSLRTPSVQTLVFGGLWTTAEGTSGFTINADITTAVASSTFAVGWLAFGH